MQKLVLKKNTIFPRKGVLLYAVLGIALMLAVFVFSYFTFMRNATQMTRKIMDSEIAYHLAQSGLSAGVAWFENTRNPCSLKERLIISTVSSVNGMTADLPVADHGPLVAILSDTGLKASLEVTLELIDFKPMYSFDKSVSGIHYEDVEKIGILKVTSKGSYDGARRTLVANKQVRVVCAVPYVVSRFTLFVQDFSSTAKPSSTNFANRLNIKKDGFSTSTRAKGYPYYGAMTLHNGDDPDIEKRGWVFLGASQPRYLNLSYGLGPDGEEHHLLPTPWELTGNGALSSGFTTKFIQKGMFADIQNDNIIFRHLNFQEPSIDPVTDKSSLLRIFGTSEKPSATITIGPVYRRFLMLRYLRHVSTNKHVVLPFASESIFDTQGDLFPPGLLFNVKMDAFSGNYNPYSACMSTLFEESYNVSVDLIMNSGYSGMVPPSVLKDLKKLKDIDDRDGFLYIPECNLGEVEILTEGGMTLFEGSLRRIGSREMYCMKKRSTYSVPATVFPSFLASNPGKIPGIIHFSGSGVTIDKPLLLRDGGIISVDGDITIKASVKTMGMVPLTLMSLTGDIILDTDSSIEASLVALDGTVKKTDGLDVTIKGNLVVKSLDIDRFLRGSGDVNLTYNTQLDPSVPSISAYRCFLSPERSYCQE